MFALNTAANKFDELGFELIASIKPKKNCKFVGKLEKQHFDDKD